MQAEYNTTVLFLCLTSSGFLFPLPHNLPQMTFFLLLSPLPYPSFLCLCLSHPNSNCGTLCVRGG